MSYYSFASCSMFPCCQGLKACGEKYAKALLIEDDPIVVGYLRHVLACAGCSVLCGCSASEGLELFSENCTEVDFIIMDYQLPGMHATRLLTKIRDISAGVHVFLASGYTEDFIKNDFPLEQVTAFIQKPFQADLLLDLIASECRRRIKS